jgi:hypothetical protein
MYHEMKEGQEISLEEFELDILGGRRKVEKLAICYPWVSPFIWTLFVENILNLERPPNSRWFRGTGWCPARRHIDFCEKAVTWGASHILILGADQIYEPNMITRLISRIENDHCDVISAMVPTRGHVARMNMRPFQPMAWRFKSGVEPRLYRSYEQDGAEMIDVINPADGDLQKIDFIGSGVLMFPTDSLKLVPKPWFGEVFTPQDMKRLASMDTRFVWELKTRANLQCWVDTTIKVGHLNTFVIDDSFQYRFNDWTERGYGECTPSGMMEESEKHLDTKLFGEMDRQTEKQQNKD